MKQLARLTLCVGVLLAAFTASADLRYDQACVANLQKLASSTPLLARLASLTTRHLHASQEYDEQWFGSGPLGKKIYLLDVQIRDEVRPKMSRREYDAAVRACPAFSHERDLGE